MFHDEGNISAILLVIYIIFLFILYFLDGILSLVISKISFIPKHFGDKFDLNNSSASLIDPCYSTSIWAIPWCSPCTTRLQMRCLFSSSLWRHSTSWLAHCRAGRFFLTLKVASWLAQAGTQNFILYAECFSRAKTVLIVYNKIIILTYLSALSQCDLQGLCFG